MKKLFLLLLILIIPFALMADNNTLVLLESSVSSGYGIEVPATGTPNVGDTGFYFYFTPAESTAYTVSGSTISFLEDNALYDGGDITLNVFYNGNEVLANAGKHKLVMEASPWTNQSQETNKDTNTISTVATATSDNDISVTASSGTNAGSLNVVVVKAGVINNQKVGSYTFSWPSKTLAAGSYQATINVQVEATT